MLSINELNELEQRYNNMKFNKNSSRSLKQKGDFYKYGIVAVLVTILLATFFGTKSFSNDERAKKEHNQSEISMLKATIAELKFKLSQTQKSSNGVIENKKIANNIENATQIQKPTKESEQGYLRLNFMQMNYENSYQSPKDDNKLQKNDSKKAKIQINTKTIKNDGQNLSSNSYFEFLKIAQNSYENANYKEAQKFALKANEIDNESEDSWIVFAKATYKLGNKDDALHALQAYNLGKNTKNVNLIIKKIKMDEL